MLAAIDSNTPMGAHAKFLFVEVTAFSSADSDGIRWTSTWAWLIVPAVISIGAFMPGARSRRIIKSPGIRAS